MAIRIEKTAWSGWPNCYRISNGVMDLVVTSDIGPRIMRFGFEGGQNFFKVYEEQTGKSGEAEWQFRGGHRLWKAPEDFELTYAPDNDPAEITIDGDVLTATQRVEPSTGLRKQLVITMAADAAEVRVLHRIRNTLPFTIEFAPWALTMLAQGGTAITGFPPRGRHEDVLAPTNPLVMWAFTDLRDPRWTFLEKYLVLRQDPHNTAHTKLGHFNEKTWGAYVLGSEMFLKRYRADGGRSYPDMGCSYETFTSADMLEIETLGPLSKVDSGGWVEHTELWSLHHGIVVEEYTDPVLDRILLPLVEQWK